MQAPSADRGHLASQRFSSRIWWVLLVWLASTHIAHAGPVEDARRIHDRLTGVPPTPAVLESMRSAIADDLDPVGAALLAIDHPAFYNTTLKDFVAPWTNEERTIYEDLNDYIATVIGMVRDEVPFDQVLSADLVYVGAPGVVATAYTQTDNVHYEELEAAHADLSDPAVLVPRTQSGLPGSQITEADAAGIITTRAAGKAFFSGGTNRAMLRFTMINYLCRDMEALSDISRPADRIRQDVSRSPGGDSSLFHSQCSGCHSGMDPMAGAFAYFEWDEDTERVVHTPGQVQPKYLINANTFSAGYITGNNRWDNFWRSGTNAYLDWRGPNSGGFGAKSFGEEVASSRAFSICQVEKVFRKVCLRSPKDEDEQLEVERIADVFEDENYDMKSVFAEVAASCLVE